MSAKSFSLAFSIGKEYEQRRRRRKSPLRNLHYQVQDNERNYNEKFSRMKIRKKQHSNEAGDPCEADLQSDKERFNQPQRGKLGIPA